jgi:large subunit ribosomal protein L18
MNRLSSKLHNANRRKNRVRTTLRGSTQRPRLSVHVSSRHISAQIIDDAKQITIAQATTVGQKISSKTMTEQAEVVGAEIAKRAKDKKIKTVAFDRGQRLYHGRIKALAEAARKEGLEF